MKKMVLVITLVAFAISGSAFAQDPAYVDNIGMYLDMGATMGCVNLPAGASTAYLVMTQMTAPDISAWEAKITFEGLLQGTWTFFGDFATDLGGRVDEHIVGFASPTPVVNGTVVLGQVDFFVPTDYLGAPVTGAVYVDEIYFSLQENGLPAYIDSNDNAYTVHPINTANPGYGGSVSDPIFIVNGDCGVVANEEASFGSVKSLFR